ncbi:MAG: hypothetical protein ACRYFR_04160 [Janthinobacterium lividum]
MNTAESYNGEIVLQGDCLFIPVINLGLMEKHPLNEQSNRQVFADRSYLVFEGVESMRYDDPEATIQDVHRDDVFYFGAYNLFDPALGELRIVYETGELLLLSDSRISLQQWTPLPTPNFKQNMVDDQVLPFLRNAALGALNSRK